MARKTMIRQLAKRAPVSPELFHVAEPAEVQRAEIRQQLQPALSRTDEVLAQLEQQIDSGKLSAEQKAEIDNLIERLNLTDEGIDGIFQELEVNG